MRAVADKPKAAQQAGSAKSPRREGAHREQSSAAMDPVVAYRSIGNQAARPRLPTQAEELEGGSAGIAWPHFTHDFGQVPVRRPAHAAMPTNLAISESGDACEREATQASDRVMRAELPAAGAKGVVARSKSALLPSAGRPLDAGARAFMEPRFGADLGDVRVHTDSAAAAAAAALQARAFTLGSDIAFAAGAYRPETDDGRRLLAHELAHTLQAGADILRRSALSDDIQATWDVTPTLDALLARLSRADVQAAQNDTDIDSKIAGLLSGRAGDLWVAQRIRQGRLGATAGARPVEAHFVQGTTTRRALVIAGVHGSERQGIEVAGILLADLAANQPAYTVIVVPSLFPDNAAAAVREGTTPTNRNFPLAGEDLAAATAAGGGTAVDASTDRAGARTRAILPENIMLLQLIERFGPERIISIHGTRHSGAGGVFYDPIRPNAADTARARQDARGLAYMQVPIEQQASVEGQERLRQAEERNFHSAIAAMAHRDRAPALAAAAQIDAATTAITGRERRPMEREGETTVDPAERRRRRAHPSVAGNVGASGDIDTAFWSGSTPGGVSLGNYASQRGISIFTVEPPFNLRTRDYPSTLDAQVDAAERRVELQAYADAIRTVLLGS